MLPVCNMQSGSLSAVNCVNSVCTSNVLNVTVLPAQVEQNIRCHILTAKAIIVLVRDKVSTSSKQLEDQGLKCIDISSHTLSEFKNISHSHYALQPLPPKMKYRKNTYRCKTNDLCPFVFTPLVN